MNKNQKNKILNVLALNDAKKEIVLSSASNSPLRLRPNSGDTIIGKTIDYLNIAIGNNNLAKLIIDYAMISPKDFLDNYRGEYQAYDCRMIVCQKCNDTFIYEFYLQFSESDFMVNASAFPFHTPLCVRCTPYVICKHSKTLEDYRVPSSYKCPKCGIPKICVCEEWNRFITKKKCCWTVSYILVCDDCY